MTTPLMTIINAGKPRPMLMTKITRSEKSSLGGVPQPIMNVLQYFNFSVQMKRISMTVT
jgi:hypothetical protein